MEMWLQALLREKYPRRCGLRLLTLALRPAATAHYMVQPCTDEEILSGQAQRLKLTANYPLPTPLHLTGTATQEALHRLHHDLERLNEHGPDSNLQQRVEFHRQHLEQLGVPREAQP